MTNCNFDVTPLSTAVDSKTSNLVNINYTNQDYYSLKSRLVDFINQRFGTNGTEIPNTFNDFVESSIAIMLIENFAFIADTLSFKMDQQVNELFIDTVREVENAFRLCKLVGFKPTPPIASTSFWTATINTPLTTDLFIPTPVSINLPTQTTVNTTIELFSANSSNEPIYNQDIIIPAGQTLNKTVIGVEGRTITEVYSGNGTAGQTIQLGSFPVIFDSIMVQVDGSIWDQVDYFTDSQPRMEYRVEFNSQWQAFIMFGNNRAGLLPSIGSVINISYRRGGGVAGNIVTGAIESQQQISVPGLDYTIPITFRNYTAGLNGYNGDGISDVVRKLPQWINTQNRAVTGNDYKTIAEQFATPYFGQIGKATAILRNYGCSGNIIDIYILALNATTTGTNLINANDDLKYALNQEINNVKMLTDFVCLKNGSTLSVDVMIDLTVSRNNRKFEQEINDQVNTLTNSFFNLNNWDFGEVLKDSDIIKQLAPVKEIESIQITFVTQDGTSGQLVSPKFYEIIVPDTISVNFTYD